MSQLLPCHVGLDGTSSGVWNMAFDEALLNAAVESGFCALRFYAWDQPTVTLGHFQPPDDPILNLRFPTLPRIRRLSGGGAILHDRELTYSCVVPADHPLARNPGSIYDEVHARIVAVLTDLGVSCGLRGSQLVEPEPFLCFGRGDARDIILNGHKIVGSAQRRRRGAILQHGSILLSASLHAPEFPGIQELTGHQLHSRELAELLAPRVSPLLGLASLETTWPVYTRECASTLVANYQSPAGY